MTEDKQLVRAFECPNHGWYVETAPRAPEGLYAACPEGHDEWCKTQNVAVSELRELVGDDTDDDRPENEIITAREALERIDD